MTYNEERYSSCGCTCLKKRFVPPPASLLLPSSSVIVPNNERDDLSPTVEYYTKKRIECLHERMDEIQISSFVKFINHHLSSKFADHRLVTDLTEDLANGDVFLDLIEIFSSRKLKREHGRTRFHALTNVQYVLNYLKTHHMHQINISPHEIVSGNRKQILALLWIIMKVFDFPSFRLTSTKRLFFEQTILTGGHDRTELLQWLTNLFKKISPENPIQIKDFHLSTWLNEEHLFQLIKFLAPLTGQCSTLDYIQHLQHCQIDGQTKEERFQAYLNLSEFCFQTKNNVDFQDRTEKSLLKYFSDLYSQVLKFVDEPKESWKKELIEIDRSDEGEDYLVYSAAQCASPLSTDPIEPSENPSNPRSKFLFVLLLIICSFFAVFFFIY